MPSSRIVRAMSSSDKVANVTPMLERALDARAQRAAVVGSVAVAGHLEALAIVLLEKSDHQTRGRMLVKAAGQVADAQAPGSAPAPAGAPPAPAASRATSGARPRAAARARAALQARRKAASADRPSDRQASRSGGARFVRAHPRRTGTAARTPGSPSQASASVRSAERVRMPPPHLPRRPARDRASPRLSHSSPCRRPTRSRGSKCRRASRRVIQLQAGRAERVEDIRIAGSELRALLEGLRARRRVHPRPFATCPVHAERAASCSGATRRQRSASIESARVAGQDAERARDRRVRWRRKACACSTAATASSR